MLKDEELQMLKEEYENWEELIKYFDEYIEIKGHKSKNHYLSIKKWVVSAVDEEKNKKQKSNVNRFQKNNHKELTPEEKEAIEIDEAQWW